MSEETKNTDSQNNESSRSTLSSKHSFNDSIDDMVDDFDISQDIKAKKTGE